MHCSMFASRPYQYGPSLYVRSHLNQRGCSRSVLAYYPLGSGKTLAALAAAREYVGFRPKAKVVVLTTKSNIETSWRDNVEMFAAAEGFRFDALCVKNVDWWFSEDNTRLANYNRLIRLLAAHTKCARRGYLSMSWYQLVQEIKFCKRPSKQLRAMKKVLCATPDKSYLQVCCPKDYFMIVDECQQYVNSSASSDVVYRLCRKAGFALLLSATPLDDRRQYEGLCRMLGTRDIDSRVLYVKPSTAARVHHRYMGSKMTPEEWREYVYEKSKRDDAYLSRGRQFCNTASKWQRMYRRIRKDVAKGARRTIVYSFFRDHGADGFCDHMRVVNDMECRLMSRPVEDMAWFHEASAQPKVLVITSRAQMGISLMGVDAFHLMEPQWSASDEQQAVGRVTRIGSHAHGQRVCVYHWVATAPSQKYTTADESVLSSMRQKQERTARLLERMSQHGSQKLKTLLATFGICSI